MKRLDQNIVIEMECDSQQWAVRYTVFPQRVVLQTFHWGGGADSDVEALPVLVGLA